jgi:dihydrodipicolinate synthase/N-acetylneuraminate lyase
VLHDAIVACDARQSLEPQRRLIPATNRIVGTPGVAACRGYYGGPVREPLLPLGEAQKKEVEALLASLAPAAATA